MFGWNHFVGGLAGILCAVAQVYGGNLGMAILSLSVLVRLALLPLTVRLARHAHDRQKLFYQLKDELARLRKRHRDDPQRLMTETRKVYERHGLNTMNTASVAGSLVQLLFGAGLYSAIRRNLCPGGRFLWIRNLGQPDGVLVLLTGALTFFASLIAPHLPEHNRYLAAVIPAAMTVIVAWRLSSAIVLYWAASAAMNGLQNFILRKTTAA